MKLGLNNLGEGSELFLKLLPESDEEEDSLRSIENKLNSMFGMENYVLEPIGRVHGLVAGSMGLGYHANKKGRDYKNDEGNI